MNNYFQELGKIHSQQADEQVSPTTPISFQISEEHLKRLDFYSSRMGLNRTNFLHLLVNVKIYEALWAYAKAAGKTIDDLDLSNLSEDSRRILQREFTLRTSDKDDSKPTS